VPDELATTSGEAACIDMDTTHRAWVPKGHSDHLRTTGIASPIRRFVAYQKRGSQHMGFWEEPVEGAWFGVDRSLGLPSSI
jgi:hypothetical protein